MAWALLATFVVFTFAAFAVCDTELIRRRTRMPAGTLPLDRAVSMALFFFLFPLPAVTAGLDVGRFHWSPPLTTAAMVCGLLVFWLGYAFALWAMHENRFFETFVRIQEDRGQLVVRSGPYAVVRHPGYAGGILAHLALPIALGSYWALVPTVCGVAAIVLRTRLEDHLLQAGLAGYRDYARAVRWRLVPGLW